MYIAIAIKVDLQSHINNFHCWIVNEGEEIPADILSYVLSIKFNFIYRHIRKTCSAGM